jgi:hypothetical protein
LINYQKKNLLRELPDRFSSSEEDDGYEPYSQVVRQHHESNGSLAKE